MKIDVQVPDGKSGNWEVSTFEVSPDDAFMFNLGNASRRILPGTYKKLTRLNRIIMSNTPAEINDHCQFIYQTMNGGKILINGLGLGVVLAAILKNDKIESVTVIEKSPDVIALVAPHFADDDRVEIINADAFTWKPPKGVRYDVVWHDIWDNICEDNLPEMTKLHRKYGRRCDWQDSWCKRECKPSKSRKFRR